MATERLLDDPALVERARAMRATGATYEQIKSELKVGNSTVSRLLGTSGQDRKPRITAEIRVRAEKMREVGRSVTDIAQELDIARSTAWLLTRGTPRLSGTGSAVGAVRTNRASVRRSNKIRRQQTKHRWARHVGDLTGRELLLVGAAIYWAEGAKDKPWRHDEALTFVNSDPLMITVFLRWLDLLGVDRSRLTFRLQIHESADVDAALRYWAKVAAVSSGVVQAHDLEAAQSLDDTSKRRLALPRLPHGTSPTVGSGVSSRGRTVDRNGDGGGAGGCLDFAKGPTGPITSSWQGSRA